MPVLINTTPLFTPGPWYAVKYPWRYDLQAFPDHGAPNLLDFVDEDEQACKRVEANSTLVAAAPSLYNALRNITEAFGVVCRARNQNPVEFREYGEAIDALVKAINSPSASREGGI